MYSYESEDETEIKQKFKLSSAANSEANWTKNLVQNPNFQDKTQIGAVGPYDLRYTRTLTDYGHSAPHENKTTGSSKFCDSQCQTEIVPETPLHEVGPRFTARN